MVTKALITPSVLRWAREDAGYSQADVVKKLKRKRVTVEVLTQWEKGKECPTMPQFRAMAKMFKRPINLFYLNEHPKESTLSEEFRAVPSTKIKDIPPRIRYLVRVAKTRIVDLREMVPVAIKARIHTFSSKEGENAEDLAIRLRKELGFSTEEQLKRSTNDDQAFKKWRVILEKVGIWVFKEAFKEEKYCGFCVNDKHFPVIFVNNSHVHVRNIFTLFHELCHLLIAKAGIDFREEPEDYAGRYQKDEVYCNAFAGAFLVPSSEKDLQVDEVDYKLVLKLAKKYNVSLEVMARRFLDLKKITRSEYSDMVRRRKIETETESMNLNSDEGGNFYNTQQSYLGQKYLRLVLREYYKESINEYQAAVYLGVNISALHGLSQVTSMEAT